MARLVIEIKDEIFEKIKRQAKEAKMTIKAFVLKALGLLK